MGDSMIIGQLQKLTLLPTILFVLAYVLTTTSLSYPNLNHVPTSKKQDAGGLILKLIHRDLIYPPSKYEHDPPVAHAAVLGSNLPKGKHINQTSYHKKQRGELFTRGAMFYVYFYIGMPGVRQFAILDTGSSFLWVQCAGYLNGQETNNTVYNPHASRSYIRSYCQGPAARQYCGLVSHNRCDEENRCKYNIEYKDGSHSEGHIGFETISFSAGGYRNRTASVSNVLFGCGTNNYDTNPVEDGVFGIGGILQLSIVRQTGGRFSFCIGSIIDKNYKYNHLALGYDARLEGAYVPYQLMGGDGYGVRLDVIRIGATTIPLPRNFIVVIDSGSTLSTFETSVYNIIHAQVDKTIGRNMQRKHSAKFPNGLCYELTHIWNGFPIVNIVSGGQTLLVLNIEGMFWRNLRENTFCLAIEPSDDGSNLLGVVAMQFHNVGFDLNTSRAYFNRKHNCYRPRATT